MQRPCRALTPHGDTARLLLDSGEPGQALFDFLRLLVLDWGATNHGLKKAFAGSEIKIKTEGAEDAFLAILGELLRTAQEAGTARTDVGAAEVKGSIIGCQAMQTYNTGLAERLVDVVFDGLRAAPAEALSLHGRSIVAVQKPIVAENTARNGSSMPRIGRRSCSTRSSDAA